LSFNLLSEAAYAITSFDALIKPTVVGAVGVPTPNAPGTVTVVPLSVICEFATVVELLNLTIVFAVPETVTEVPEEPDDPLDPDVPLDPEEPLDPDVPEEPELPDVPEEPLDPELPDVPEEPELPDVPLDPDVPEVAAAYEVPLILNDGTFNFLFEFQLSSAFAYVNVAAVAGPTTSIPAPSAAAAVDDPLAMVIVLSSIYKLVTCKFVVVPSINKLFVTFKSPVTVNVVPSNVKFVSAVAFGDEPFKVKIPLSCVPVIVTVPEEPDVPAVPLEPEEPDVPDDPDEPLDPEVPDEPDVPDEPLVPEEPEEPDVPEEPLDPDVPDDPLDPDDPEVPLEPAVPLDPDVPEEPLDPDVPEEPEVDAVYDVPLITTSPVT
jgi:hypothetical protein